MTSWQLQFEDDAGAWADVDASTNPRVAIGNHFSDRSYDYDLEMMFQTNRRTGHTRALRLVSLAANTPAWGFEESAGNFEESPSLSSAITARKAAHLPVDHFMMHASWGASYDVTIDATTGHGTQTNNNSGMSRTIQPIVAAQQPAAAPAYAIAEEPEDVDIPDDLKCPITSTLMTQPVRTSDGFVYENSAITQWFAKHSKSPMTGLPLMDKALRVDTDTLFKLAAFRAAHK